MSKHTTIEVQSKVNISPKQILQAFIDNGFTHASYENTYYSEPALSKDGSFNWQSFPTKSFDIEAFLERHKPDTPAAISLSKDEFDSDIYIEKSRIQLVINVPDNIPFLEEWDCQDFSWCLNKLAFLADLIEPESIECAVIY